MTGTIQPTIDQTCIDKTSALIAEVTVWGGLGYLCGHALMIINPISLGFFAAVTRLISHIVSPFFERAFYGMGLTDESTALGDILSAAASSLVAKAITPLLGYSISFSAGGFIFLSMVAVTLIGRVGVVPVKPNQEVY